MIEFFRKYNTNEFEDFCPHKKDIYHEYGNRYIVSCGTCKYKAHILDLELKSILLLFNNRKLYVYSNCARMYEYGILIKKDFSKLDLTVLYDKFTKWLLLA